MQLAPTSQFDRPYQGLLYGVFQQPRDQAHQGLVVALTSANPGEGVTHVARELMVEIEGHSSSRTLLADMEWLKGQPPNATDDGLIEPSTDSWNASFAHRKACIRDVRSRYRNVIIDCPSLAKSRDVLSLAPLVDGILLVVEANRTRKEQIRNAERQLVAAGGNILGLVLNRWRRDVPDWLYNLL